jgi:hypothetical protein
VVRLKPFQAAIRLYGRLSLLTWYRNNRKLLQKLRRDDQNLFLPLRGSGADAGG